MPLHHNNALTKSTRALLWCSENHSDSVKLVVTYIGAKQMKIDTEGLDKTVSEIVRKISAAVPEDLKTAKEGLEKNARATVEGAFQRLDLVTREEFDVQVILLSKSQQRVKELEQRISELEEAINKK